MNKKGQTDIISWIVVVVAILMLAPLMLYIVNTTLDPLETQLNATNTAAGDSVGVIHDTFVSFWDWIIAIAFLLNMVLLFVFAFLAGPHPIFSLFYLISAAITLMFSRYIMAPITTIFGMSEFSTEVLQLPIVDFIVTRFDIILLGVIIVTGIIMYSSFKNEGGLDR